MGDVHANTKRKNGPPDPACGCYRASTEGGRVVRCGHGSLLFVCAVARDVEGALDLLIPARGPYRHSEGNSDSHVKSVLVGASQVIHVEGGKLVLGRWQGVFFCEFDGPRDRRLQIKVVAD